MSDITLAVGNGALGSAEVSYGTDPRPPDSVSPGTDPLTAIAIQTRSQAVEMLREDVEHERDRADRAERQVEEEWDDPLISGIGWVSELVEIAGGMDMFADRSGRGAAKDRVVTFDEVIVQEPDLIIGSWCGKKFRPERVMARPAFDRIPAVQHQEVYEIKSSLILQPGPAALTDGLAEIRQIIEHWAGR